MNYEEACKYITESVTPGSVYGLARVKELARRIAVPDTSTKIIHIAGTNGKGSTSRIIASILQEAGFTVGIFNSPFLLEPTEYLCVNNTNATRQEYADIIYEIKQAIDEWKSDETAFDMPTEFEISVCAALLYFKKNRCQYTILECGLGGLEDATNFIPKKDIAVLTNIGLDHTGILGDTIEKIAFQKSGIIKEGCDVVAYPSCNKALNIFTKKAIEEHSNIYIADKDSISNEYLKLIEKNALKGEFQKSNSIVALKVIDIINKKIANETNIIHCTENANKVTSSISTINNSPISLAEIEAGLKNVIWHGRFDIFKRNPYIIVDGGHNEQCIDALIASLDQIHIDKAIFVVGVMADKSHKKMFEKLSKFVKYVITTEPANPRRLPAEDSLNEWKEFGVDGEVIITPAHAIKRAVELSNDIDNIVVSGSLYMVGEILNELKLIFNK